ncbi:hypothetical protein [Halosimplex salinum]|uniref:hypothetical protein n=1 Tax=Halosimplex salinum TaxID=1710538 RepID=UPI000F482586|nr:hypothetical protein [Halosimplex salinum]
MSERPVASIAPRTYRWLDRLTKLGGVALVAAGLEAGGGTATGLILGLSGAALATSTVFLTIDSSESTDE